MTRRADGRLLLDEPWQALPCAHTGGLRTEGIDMIAPDLIHHTLRWGWGLVRLVDCKILDRNVWNLSERMDEGNAKGRAGASHVTCAFGAEDGWGDPATGPARDEAS